MRSDPWLNETETRELARARTAVRLSSQPVSQWHYRRAIGVVGRIEAVVTCEDGDEIEITCHACNKCTVRGVRCANRLLCRSCRGVLASRYRVRFAAARTVLLDEARALGLLYALKNSLRRFEEKLLTLTAPHFSGSTGKPIDVRKRVTWIHNAYELFMAKVRRKLRGRLTAEALAKQKANGLEPDNGAARAAADEALSCFHYLRSYEWTSGSDGHGHPHVHVWLLAPFLPIASGGWWRAKDGTLADWWRESLERAGEDLGILVTDKRVIVDCRAADHETVANELIKYLLKDIQDGQSGSRYVDAKIFARVVEAFDGKRLIQASRGFIEKGGRAKARCGCGEEGRMSARISRKEPQKIAERDAGVVMPFIAARAAPRANRGKTTSVGGMNTARETTRTDKPFNPRSRCDVTRLRTTSATRLRRRRGRV